jgi:hypothetical protein
MQTSSGIVKEFVSPSGVVFAFTWKGLVHPDLRVLMGSYFSEYQAESIHQPRSPGSRHQQVRTAHVIVEKGGHMRAVRGRAYVPNLIPTGVKLDEIL